MRALFISNFYPPKQRGGYEEWCQEIAKQFLIHGHTIKVLTSKYLGDDEIADPTHVSRSLNLEMDIASLSNAFKFFTHRKKRLSESINALESCLDNFHPDVALVWGMWNLPFEIPALLEERLPRKVAYYLGDYWPSLPPQFQNYWNAKPANFVNALPKSILSVPAKVILRKETRPSLNLATGLFCSNYLKENLEKKGISFDNQKVIYGAIDTAPYQAIAEKRQTPNPQKINILSLGRLIPDKGIKTIILAMKKLADAGSANVCLKIVGSGDEKYEAELKNLVQEMQLSDQIVFTGSVDKSKVPDLYRQADIFVFASIWPEPFGRVIVEAMASRVAVVGTSVGGAAEILEDGKNALTFEPENAVNLAEKLEVLIKNSSRKDEIVEQAFVDATTKFDTSRMYREIKDALAQLTTKA